MIASDAQGKFLQAVADGEISTATIYLAVPDRDLAGASRNQYSINRGSHRHATVDACLRREWVVIDEEGDVRLSAAGWQVFRAWIARILERGPSPAPALTDREGKVLGVLQAAAELGYRLVPDPRRPECGPEVDRLRRMGYVSSYKRQMRPTPLGEIQALPDTDSN